MDVLLTFTNESLSTALQNHTLVLFQKNVFSGNFQDSLIAWRVFELNEPLKQQRFHVSTRLSVSAKDASGSVSEPHLTDNGQHWAVVKSRTRDWMILSGDATTRDRVEIRNMLPKESVEAQIYKDGRLLSVQSGLTPGDTASFAFDNVLYAAILESPVNAGEKLPPVSQMLFLTELVLDGFAKASLVFSGAGPLDSGVYNLRLVPESLKAAV